MDKIPNEVISIQFRRDYILIETIEGCREIEYRESPTLQRIPNRNYIEGGIPNVWIDNLQAMGLSLYQWPDKVNKYYYGKKKST